MDIPAFFSRMHALILARAPLPRKKKRHFAPLTVLQLLPMYRGDYMELLPGLLVLPDTTTPKRTQI